MSKLTKKFNQFAKVFFVIALSLMICAPAATNAAGFEAGNIISNYDFTNKDSMSVSQIQQFLNNKNSLCLKDKTTGAILGNNNYGSTVSAATAIKQASNLFNISPRVLLVTLQKEQGLVTRGDCPTWRYRTAMGFGCPDGGSCDSKWFGLNKQLYQGARHFDGFFNQRSGWYVPYRPGLRYIKYGPQSACGGKNVNIENNATASLYSYTPYTPDSNSLQAGYGASSNSSCFSYGNRNFYLYFRDWFGFSNQVLEFEPLENPRWKAASGTISKYDLTTGEQISSEIPEGTEIYFPSKYLYNGNYYLRTKYDTDRNKNLGILASDLDEINLVFSPLDKPRWIRVSSGSKKIYPITENSADGDYGGEDMFFDTKAVIGGNVYLRTKEDTASNTPLAITRPSTTDIKLRDYKSLDKPRRMEALEDTEIIDPITGEQTGVEIEAGEQVFFETKLEVAGTLFLRDKTSTNSSISVGLDRDNFGKFIPVYSDMIEPRRLSPKSDLYKRWFETDKVAGDKLRKGRSILFTTKTVINGDVYLRTEYDSLNNKGRGILIDLLKD